MTARGTLRLANRALSADESAQVLELAAVMRIGTVDGDGWPYVVPLSFVYHDGKVYFHHTNEESHLTESLEKNPRVCVEVDEAGPVFHHGESACGTGRVFRSVVAFGKVSLVADPRPKMQAFERLLVKYAPQGMTIPRVYSRLDETLVFQIDVELMTGKRADRP